MRLVASARPFTSARSSAVSADKNSTWDDVNKLPYLVIERPPTTTSYNVVYCWKSYLYGNLKPITLYGIVLQMERDRTGQADTQKEEEEEDFFNVTIERSGCSKEHYALQDCFSDKGDWRQCGAEMTQFRACMVQQKNRAKIGSGGDGKEHS